jgi:hypothetical protein
LLVGQAQVASLAAARVEYSDEDVGAFGPFDLGRRHFAALPGDRVAVDRDDHVADLDPGTLRRRTVEDAVGPQAPLHPGHRQSDAGEAAVDLFVEALQVLR